MLLAFGSGRFWDAQTKNPHFGVKCDAMHEAMGWAAVSARVPLPSAAWLALFLGV